jgi:glycosyltransferase involved in cell wall biosynthesis
MFSRQTFWQGLGGGMEIHGKLLSEGMVQKGHSVTIISTRHPNGQIFEEKKGVKIYYLKNTVFGSRRKRWKTESVDKFVELHKNRKFDVVWSQSFDAFGFTRSKKDALKVPIVAILHGCLQQELKSFIANILNFKNNPQKTIKTFAGLFLTYLYVQRSLILISDKIISVSNEVANSFAKLYGHKFIKKNLVVLNGVDTSQFYPPPTDIDAIRNEYASGNTDVLLLALGRTTKEKGFHIAIEALNMLLQNNNANYKLLIVGDGEYLAQLKRKVRESKLEKNVLFTGFIENINTAKYYNSADIVLNPSLTAEGSSFVTLEAMACAKPVIASKTGGINSIIKDKQNGLTVEPGDPHQLSTKIALLSNDRKLANRLAASGRKSVLKEFSADIMIDKTLEAMASIVRR